MRAQLTALTSLFSLSGCQNIVPPPDPIRETDPADVPANEQCNRLTCESCTASADCGWCADESGHARCMLGGDRHSEEAVCRGTWYAETLECPDSSLAEPECTDAPSGLLSQTEMTRTESAIMYRQEYLSDGLRILGVTCVPTTDGPHPIALFHHGGFDGLGGDIGPRGFCQSLAASGFVAVMSQYRGEDDPSLGASEGEMEYCTGEVTDSLNLLEIVKKRCDVDGSRIVVLGGSHGGCNTLQAIRRSTPGTFEAAAVFFPPTDLAEIYEYFYRQRLNLNPFVSIPAIYFFNIIHGIMKGPPSTDPEGYAVRSPVNFSQEIADTGVPILLVHGLTDSVVPYSHSCQMRDALGDAGATFTDFHLRRFNLFFPRIVPTTDQVRGCCERSFSLDFPQTSNEFRDAGNVFVLVDDYGHEAPRRALMDAVNDFLGAHIESNRRER